MSSGQVALAEKHKAGTFGAKVIFGVLLRIMTEPSHVFLHGMAWQQHQIVLAFLARLHSIYTPRALNRTLSSYCLIFPYRLCSA
jgi:hypothetical protein